MGESVPAANLKELQIIISAYIENANVALFSGVQIDPDATIFEVTINGAPYFILEEDYISDLEGVLIRFTDHGLREPKLERLLDPPEAFDYEPFLKDRPEYFTKENDDYNRLRLYETNFQPAKLNYVLHYFVAGDSK